MAERVLPCIYSSNGCTVQLTLKDIIKHSAVCKKKTDIAIACPIDNCTYVGSKSSLHSHLASNHRANIMPNNIIKPTNSKRQAYVILHGPYWFLVNISSYYKNSALESQIPVYMLYVHSLHPAICFKYQVELSNTEQRSELKSVSRHPGLSDLCRPLPSETFIFHLVPGNSTCMVDHENLNSKEYLEIEMEKMFFKIHIFEDTLLVLYKKVNDEILSEFECPICFCTMRRPIFQCPNGHSHCSKCRENLKKCSMCNSVKKVRNILAEKTAERIVKNCKYKSKNCNFVSQLEAVDKHEEICFYGSMPCPTRKVTGCPWEGRIEEFKQHNAEHHPETILETGEVNILFTSQDFKVPRHHCFMMETLNNTFIIFHKNDGATLYWGLKVIGPGDSHQRYPFVLHIKDNVNADLSGLVFQRSTQINSTAEEYFQIALPIEVVEPMINKTLTFTINIKQ